MKRFFSCILFFVSLFVFASFFVFTSTAISDDLSYIDIDELNIEIEAREGDIARTNLRLASLSKEINQQEQVIDSLNVELEKIEKHLIAKTAMLYKMSRHGKAVRYLFSSDSGTPFLKRLQTLRHLISSELESRRKTGARLAEIQGILLDLNAEYKTAVIMLSQLEEARNELLFELQRREQETADVL